MPSVPPKNESTLIIMWEYSRKPMRLLSQPPETTYVIHRLYGKNRHSKLITKNTLPHVWANTPACMCQRFSMCKPIHTYVLAVRCIIFRRNLLYLSRKPSKGFPKFFWLQEPHDGCTTAATAFTMNPKRLSRGCRSVSRWLKFCVGKDFFSIYTQSVWPLWHKCRHLWKNFDGMGDFSKCWFSISELIQIENEDFR